MPVLPSRQQSAALHRSQKMCQKLKHFIPTFTNTNHNMENCHKSESWSSVWLSSIPTIQNSKLLHLGIAVQDSIPPPSVSSCLLPLKCALRLPQRSYLRLRLIRLYKIVHALTSFKKIAQGHNTSSQRQTRLSAPSKPMKWMISTLR